MKKVAQPEQRLAGPTKGEGQRVASYYLVPITERPELLPEQLMLGQQNQQKLPDDFKIEKCVLHDLLNQTFKNQRMRETISNLFLMN